MRNLLRLNIDYSNRVYGLDVYRATAILLVVFTHGRYLLNSTPLEGFPWLNVIDGVELFFVLSGFLIGSILLKIMYRESKPGIREIAVFWKRRWFRTLPNYYLILLVNYLLVFYGIINGDIKQYGFRFLIFCQNFASPMYDFFWESWSLTIEEWFYLILPVLLLLFSAFLPPKKTFLAAILLLITAPLLYRISISSVRVDSFWWDVTFRKTVMTRLDTIIYGVLAAWFKFHYSSRWNAHKNVAFFAGLVLIIGASLLPRNPDAFYTKTFSFVFPSIGAMLLLPKADNMLTFKGWLGRTVTRISVISYSMYLVNLALVAQVIEKNFPPQSVLDSFLKYALYWTAVIVISTLLYKYFEKPMMDLRDKKSK